MDHQGDRNTTPDLAWEAPIENHTLGLVLGGGGAKGGAHLGVLDLIATIGLPIDTIVGTSIGGAVGALYAAGYATAEIARAFGSATLWRLIERDPARRGLMGSRRIRAILEELLGECTFEQLDIPCAVVTTDLVTGCQVVLDSGPLVDALLATMAFPGIFPPLPRDEMLLADGGVVNNLPVDVAYARGAGRVIAVDLGSVCDNFDPEPASGGLLTRLNLLPQVPLMMANRGLAVLMAQVTRYRLAENPPDLLLCPEVEQIGLLELGRIDEARAAGAAVARDAIEDLLALRAWRAATPYSTTRASTRNASLWSDALGVWGESSGPPSTRRPVGLELPSRGSIVTPTAS